MKESINFYYNLSVDSIEEWGNIYCFKIKESIYYFVPFKRAISELDDLILVSKELKARGINAHDIMVNKMGKVVTEVYNQNYILLKPIVDIYEEFDIVSIIKINQNLVLNTSKSKLYRNSWIRLWTQKLDYFEYQIRELGKDKTLILDSFSYYLGLGENAISYVNVTLEKYKPTVNDRVCLSHRRINFPNYSLNFLNPISFIFDLEVRDIAEYIKSAFFAGENAYSYLKTALKLSNFSVFSLQLLYARLLYPTYYFDIYEKIMNDEREQDDLIPIIDKSKDYEIFMKDAYYLISEYASIDRIEWILKEK